MPSAVALGTMAAAPHLSLSTPPNQGSLVVNAPDYVRASVSQLLSRAYSLPCSTAAQAFNQLVQPTSRFQLALDALLPLLDSGSPPNDVPQRILVSFILYSLYAPHPIAINPFKSVLFVTYVKERQQVVAVSNNGGVSPNEQLVWVLWKILSGDGDDIGPYSPSTLARSPLPDKLRASILVLDDKKYLNEVDDATLYETVRFQPPARKNLSLADSIKTPAQDAQTESIAKGMQLLLAARERILTLSEQRVLTPLLPVLASSHMLTSMDLAPIIAHNATLAHPLFLALILSPASPSAAESEEDDFFSDAPHSGLIPFSTLNYLQVLTCLPPTLPSFDLLGRLLRDNTVTPIVNENGSKITVSELVKSEVLGRFVTSSVEWLDRAEREEKEGRVSDDRFSKGVQNLCRFYHSLIKLSIIDTGSDAECAEMKHFSLRHSRFEEANGLYRVLARGGF